MTLLRKHTTPCTSLTTSPQHYFICGCLCLRPAESRFPGCEGATTDKGSSVPHSTFYNTACIVQYTYMFLYILLGCIAFENKSKKAANMDYIRQCVTYAYQSLAPWINLDIHILGSILADHSFSIMKHKPLAIEAGSLESKNQVLGTPFRFLALAPELRNEIYTRVLRPDCTASCGKAVGPCNCSVVCPQIL